MVTAVAGRGRPKDKDLQAKRRQCIVEVAVKMFAKNGFDGTDVNDIARHLKISKGTIYYYYKNKQELFLAAVDFMMGQLLKAINVVLQSDADSLCVIKNSIAAYLGFCEAHPEFVELLIHERSVFKNRKKSTYFAYKEANSDPWRLLYQDLIKRGLVRNMPIERILNVVCDLLYGVIFTNHFAGRSGVQQQTDDIVDVLFKGILTPRGLRSIKKVII